MAGNEIEVAGAPAGAIQLAEDNFTPEQREQIARFLNITAEDVALMPFLGIAAHYGLDPIMGEVWLIPQKEKAKDGKPERQYLRPAVGRDGYLSIARRQPDFQGIQGDVVCEHDSFDVDWDGTRDAPLVLHRPASKPTQFKGDENPARWRGKILGAWCKVWIKDRAPQYYYAPLSEHAKTWESQDGTRKGFSGAWSYTSAMILKSAQSVALRLAFGISGFVPVDEIRDEVEGYAEEITDLTIEAAQALRALQLDIPSELEDHLVEALLEINRVAPNSWGVSKVDMVLGGADQEKVESVLDGIEGEISVVQQREAEAEKAAQDAAEHPEQEQPQPEEVVDATVIDETLDVRDIAPDQEVLVAIKDDEDAVWWTVTKSEKVAKGKIALFLERQIEDGKIDTVIEFKPTEKLDVRHPAES